MREAIPCTADLSSKSGSIASCPPSLLHSLASLYLSSNPLLDMLTSLTNCFRSSFPKRPSNASQPSKQPRRRPYQKLSSTDSLALKKNQQTYQQHGTPEKERPPVKSFNVIGFRPYDPTGLSRQPAGTPLEGEALKAHLKNIPRNQR